MTYTMLHEQRDQPRPGGWHHIICEDGVEVHEATQVERWAFEEIRRLREALMKAVLACEEHNREYHHATPVNEIAEWKRLAALEPKP